jgi:hypothetical protein
VTPRLQSDAKAGRLALAPRPSPGRAVKSLAGGIQESRVPLVYRHAMRVFVSWSGPTSKKAAQGLCDWLPNVIQTVQPFMSSDIDKGARWATDLASQLEECDFGIVCLTPENLRSSWVLFEAGALSKAISSARVVPLLLGVEVSDVEYPLAQFQATRFERDDVHRMVKSIVQSMDPNHAVADDVIDHAFAAFWPALEEKLQPVVVEASSWESDGTAAALPLPQRDDRSVLEEILALLRSQAREIGAVLQVARTELQRSTDDGGMKAGGTFRAFDDMLAQHGARLINLQWNEDLIELDIVPGPEPLTARAERELISYASRSLGRKAVQLKIADPEEHESFPESSDQD